MKEQYTEPVATSETSHTLQELKEHAETLPDGVYVQTSDVGIVKRGGQPNYCRVIIAKGTMMPYFSCCGFSPQTDESAAAARWVRLPGYTITFG